MSTNFCSTLKSFVLQLISLAGLHSTATITAELARAFRQDGMLAYVNLVQRREKELNVDVLTHQTWSGAAYVDGILGAIQSGSSSSKSMGEGNTEAGSSQHPYDSGGFFGSGILQSKITDGYFRQVFKCSYPQEL